MFSGLQKENYSLKGGKHEYQDAHCPFLIPNLDYGLQLKEEGQRFCTSRLTLNVDWFPAAACASVSLPRQTFALCRLKSQTKLEIKTEGTGQT